MKWPLVTRRSYDDLNTRYQQALDATAKARDERNAFRTAAAASARQFVEADATNQRLEGRNRELNERLAKHADAAPKAAQLEQRLHRALHACARWMNATWAETRHTDRLQARLDDAVGLHHGGHISDSRTWQPGYRKPKEDAS
ncbi:hypothetical protein ACH5A2_19620 [Streptomyces collinus]|uniref:hypothetical protein n=1 Tax=Streptomyces collinus TaxID=42684 RepID=UPI0037B36C0A